MKLSAPTSRACTISRGSRSVVTSTTGISHSAGSALIIRHSSKPVRPGIRTSLTTRSKGAAASRASAACPSPATSTDEAFGLQDQAEQPGLGRAVFDDEDTRRAHRVHSFRGGRWRRAGRPRAAHTWSRGRMKSARPALHGRPRHAVDDGRRLRLRDRAAAGPADRTQAVDAVPSHPGEDHRHRAAPEGGGHGLEEHGARRPEAAHRRGRSRDGSCATGRAQR